tara:strand:+ start:120 stop:335 length:216 start_codon:yes stop_codon:yes gene_type:complete
MRKLPKFSINNTNDMKLFWQIASLETKSRKMLRSRRLKSFSWADWYALEDYIAAQLINLKVHHKSTHRVER